MSGLDRLRRLRSRGGRLLLEESQPEQRTEHAEHGVDRQRHGKLQQHESPAGHHVEQQVAELGRDVRIGLQLAAYLLLPDGTGPVQEGPGPDDRQQRADDARHQAAQHRVCRLERFGLLLLTQIDGQEPAHDDPETAAEIQTADNRQR